MKLDDLVSAVATETGATKKQTREILTSAHSNIAKAVSEGDQILIPQLGRFSSKGRKARKGSNPSTGEKVDIPARQVPIFSYTKSVKDSVGKLDPTFS